MEEENNNSLQFSSILGRLKPFNGKVSLKNFLNQFNTRAKLENWNEESKVNILKCLCVDSAQTYLNSHPEINDLNFNELVSFLEKRFKNVISKQEAYSQFTIVRQGYLNIRDYANKIDEISENVIDILTEFENTESRDQFLISIFLSGLNYEIKKLIGIQEYSSYNNCVQAALKAEKIVPSRRMVNNVNEQKASINNPYVQCFNCRKMGHKRFNCPRLHHNPSNFNPPNFNSNFNNHYPSNFNPPNVNRYSKN